MTVVRQKEMNMSNDQGKGDQLFDSLRDFGIADPPEDDCSALILDIRGNDL